jgi:hypothetical protein
MKKLIIIGALVALTVATFGGTVVPSAKANDPVVVGIGACYYNSGGAATVPSGVPILARMLLGWGTRGAAQEFQGKQITTLTIVRGGTTTVVNVSALWSDPFDLGGFWVNQMLYSLGSLATGESVSVQSHLTLRAPVVGLFLPVGPTGENGPQMFRGDDLNTFGGCVITGA